jgi:hypothetical protein
MVTTKIKFIILLLVVCTAAFGQKAEINAFEKQNKDLLKQLKKDFDAKPEVNMTKDGYFYIVLTKKENKVSRYMLRDESGAPLHDGLLDKYQSISGGYFFIGIKNSVSGLIKYGVVNVKGAQILPMSYDYISHRLACSAGAYTNSSTNYWRPASEECWATTVNANKDVPSHTVFYSADGRTVMHEYDGKIEEFKGSYWKLKPDQSGTNANDKALLTNDGSIIYPQQYYGFYIESSGLVNCIKAEADGLKLYGGKMLNSNVSTILVPPLFSDVTYNKTENVIKVKMHRDEDYQVYKPDSTYTLSFKDNGERLFDRGLYKEVISFYEGEGYGKPWGDLYMGLAAKHLAENEQNKMDKCIKTLKSNNEYWLPIKNPDKYQFDAGTIAGMYTSSMIYLEKYINNEKVADDDPSKIKARKIRGQVAKAKTDFNGKLEDYGVALRSATTRNVQREAQIAQQQAQQQKATNDLINGLTNLLTGKK